MTDVVLSVVVVVVDVNVVGVEVVVVEGVVGEAVVEVVEARSGSSMLTFSEVDAVWAEVWTVFPFEKIYSFGKWI